MYEFEPNDYILFKRIVQPEKKFSYRTDPASGRAIVVPGIPEQVLPQGGEGQIAKIQAKPRKVLVDRTKHGEPVYESYRTATVLAGSHLGRVCAILDDATLQAKPLTLDMGLDNDATPGAGPGMYGTDAMGGA